MKFMKALIIISAIFFLTECSNSEKYSGAIKMAPDSTENAALLEMNSMLNLPRLDEASGPFELRVWTQQAMINMDFISTLRYVNGNFELTETRYWTSICTEGGDILFSCLDSLSTHKIILDSSINNLVDTIRRFGLDTILTQKRIPDFRDQTADGISYTIEFRDNNYYGCFTYSNPQFYKDERHASINRIIDFLYRHSMIPIRT